MVCASGCARPFTSSKSSSDTALESNQLVYALPQTVVLVEARFAQTQESQQRNCEVASADQHTYEPKLVSFSDFKITSEAVIDPARIFRVSLASSGLNLMNGVYEFGADGVLHGAESGATNSGVDVTIATVQTVAAIASTLVAALATGQGCADIDANIEKLKEARLKLLLSGAPNAGLLAAAQEQEIKRLEGLAQKPSRVVSGVIRCRITPDDGTTSKFTLWRVEGNEIVARAENCDFPTQSNVTAEKVDRGAKGAYSLVVGSIERPAKVAANETKVSDETPAEETVFYRLPSSTLVWIEGPDAQMHAPKRRMTIAQHGGIASIQAGRHFRRSQVRIHVALHPETGTLKKVQATLGRDKAGEAVKAGGGAVHKVLESQVERLEAKQAKEAAELQESVQRQKLEMCRAALARGEWSPAC